VLESEVAESCRDEREPEDPLRARTVAEVRDPLDDKDTDDEEGDEELRGEATAIEDEDDDDEEDEDREEDEEPVAESSDENSVLAEEKRCRADPSLRPLRRRVARSCFLGARRPTADCSVSSADELTLCCSALAVSR